MFSSSVVTTGLTPQLEMWMSPSWRLAGRQWETSATSGPRANIAAGTNWQIDANWCKLMQIIWMLWSSWVGSWYGSNTRRQWNDHRLKWIHVANDKNLADPESDMRGMLAPPVRLALPSMFFVVGKGLQMEQIQGNTIRPCRSTKPTESKRPNFPLLESSWIQGKWIIINQCLCHGAMILQDHPIFSKFQLEALTQ